MITIDTTRILQIINILILFVVLSLIIHFATSRRNQKEGIQKNIVIKNIRKNDLIYIYFYVKGRLSLKEYWFYWNIPFFLILLIFYGLEHEGVKLQSKIFSIINLLILWPVIATTVKRLHDLNKSGWWFLIHLIPFIGTSILSIFLWFVPGTKGENYYDLNE
jgi:uncharacterized membrane protein YhaH (DUF805 family)